MVVGGGCGGVAVEGDLAAGGVQQQFSQAYWVGECEVEQGWRGGGREVDVDSVGG